ncbi:MAG: DegV family protein [Oscillospiraceae bacterium]|jgi:DegV family protein with EDD domain|nr:DegV family protein [Oscillospiraceae bacterium]
MNNKPVALVTDTGSSLSPEYGAKHGISILPLGVTIGEDEVGDKSEIADYKAFYGRLRKKETSMSSCVNTEVFEQLFLDYFSKGQDVVYIGFSSGLSATFDNGAAAIAAALEKYPDRKGYAVDTKCAALGQGLLIDHVIGHIARNPNLTAAEIAQFAEKNSKHVIHLFTTDDLFFLMRGGRVSAGAAIAGSVLGLKPMMVIDDVGKIIKVGIERGRKNSIQKLADNMEKHGYVPGKGKVFISQGDCVEDAFLLETIIKHRYGVKEIFTDYLSTVIGGHSGPGTVALFFFGNKRVV